MTEETKAAPDTAAAPVPAAAPAAPAVPAPAADAATDVAVAAAVVADDAGVEAAAAVATDGSNVLLVAEFADPAAAMETYQALVDAEISGALAVSGVLVVKADASGKIQIQKVTDHSTRTGLKWGIVGGVVLGVIFPPSIIGSAAALGVTGGVLGKLRQEHHKSELGSALAGSLAPNTSGILVLATLPAVPAVKQTMPKATKVTQVPVDAATTTAITEAAKQAPAS
jgi:uncharacterized membrane protein